jgi:hypothetical protein
MNQSAQISDGMGFDRRLGGSEVGRGNQAPAQINGGGVQGVQSLLQAHSKVVVVVFLQCHPHQAFVQRLKQRDITAFVGIGQVERDIRWRRPA